jgi:hypothetical protein
MRFDVSLDKVKGRTAHCNKEVRRTPQMAFPKAIADSGELSKQLVSRDAFETVDHIRQRISGFSPEHDMDVVNVCLYRYKLTAALFEHIAHHLFEPVTNRMSQIRIQARVSKLRQISLIISNKVMVTLAAFALFRGLRRREIHRLPKGRGLFSQFDKTGQAVTVVRVIRLTSILMQPSLL